MDFTLTFTSKCSGDELPCAGLWRTGLATGCGKAVYVSHVRLFLPTFLTLLEIQDRFYFGETWSCLGLGEGEGVQIRVQPGLRMVPVTWYEAYFSLLLSSYL